jgi:transcriptional regulator with XRE-family HTH domain
MDCARLLRAARRTRRVSQRELAALAKVPHSTVDRVEAGRVVPRLPTLNALLGALGYEVVVVDKDGGKLEPDDEHDGLRDDAGRRFPAHLKYARTPDYWDRDGPTWWGWHRISWPWGVGAKPPEYTYWQRYRDG